MPACRKLNRSDSDGTTICRLGRHRFGRSKNVWAMEIPGQTKSQTGSLPHTPEAIDVWAAELATRFGGRPIAVALEQSRGPLHSYPSPRSARLRTFSTSDPWSPCRFSARGRVTRSHSRLGPTNESPLRIGDPESMIRRALHRGLSRSAFHQNLFHFPRNNESEQR